jgi:hypothetical protein
MQTAMIEEPRSQARRKFLEYRAAVASGKGTEGDEILRDTYRQIARGRRVLDLFETMKRGGADHLGRPRLAVCRADARRVEYGHDWSSGRDFFAIAGRRAWGKLSKIVLSRDTFPWDWKRRSEMGTPTAIVPTIPPALRPGPTMLRNYAILWEAEWAAPPKDPILLAPIRGQFYAVVAQWDLTPLERAVLAGE